MRSGAPATPRESGEDGMSAWDIPPVGPHRGARVLIVDDEEPLRRAFARVLQHDGHEVMTAGNGREAMQWLAQASTLDVVISDIHMPQMNGLEVLRAVREHDLDLPVLLVTADPDIATAIEAIDHDAYKYLTKPVDLVALSATVWRAVTLRRMTRLKREALALLGQETLQAADRTALEASFTRALGSSWLAYQPIVRAKDGSVHGYEALLRSNEPSLPHPGAVIDAAERLGRLDELGQKVRAAAPEPMGAAGDAMLFVNLHPRDLADETLFEADSPLGRIASRVVLEITERATLDEVGDVRDRIVRLRGLGFQLAVDDLGAGYAGLSCFATLEPEVIKFDMTLVRGIDANAVKRRVVEKMTALAHELNVLVVAEGVETAAERDVLVEIGCDLLQGYLFARPGKPFPGVTWGR
jgi:EAL domain-containing protein (putative c-di-GMP-specific phosphodiesterase class I)/AmiR/NasT family two-component response regulator